MPNTKNGESIEFIENFRRVVDSIPRPNTNAQSTADPNAYAEEVVGWLNECPAFIELLMQRMGVKCSVSWQGYPGDYGGLVDFDRFRGALLAWIGSLNWATRPDPRNSTAHANSESVEEQDNLVELERLVELFEKVLQLAPIFIPGGFDKHMMDWLERCARSVEGQLTGLGVELVMDIPIESDSIGRFLGALQMWLYTSKQLLSAKREAG